ncbi:MAG TPA: ribonuclease P protein component [Oculatellaceae cyanobacterium]
MLPTKERLTRAGVFQRAYSARKTVGTPFFSLYVLPRQERGRGAKIKNQSANPASSAELVKMQPAALPLVGFVVAKKVSKSACVRNKAKRRLREAYRLLRLSNPDLKQELAQWYAMVFVVHAKAFEASWTELQEAVSESIVKAGAKHGVHRPQSQGVGGAAAKTAQHGAASGQRGAVAGQHGAVVGQEKGSSGKRRAAIASDKNAKPISVYQSESDRADRADTGIANERDA